MVQQSYPSGKEQSPRKLPELSHSKWLVVCAAEFHRIGHRRDATNNNQVVLIGKDRQEISAGCGAELTELINKVFIQAFDALRYDDERAWDKY